jgi:hypothetical protein
MEATRATEPQSHRDAERRLLRRATEQQSCKGSEMNGRCNSYAIVLQFFSAFRFLHAFYLFYGQHGSARSTIKLTRSHLHGHGSENIFFFITASVTTKSALRHTVYTTRL